MLDFHVEAAVLLEDKEFLEHAIEELDSLGEGDVCRLTSKELHCLHVCVDRHLLFVVIEEHFYIYLILL